MDDSSPKTPQSSEEEIQVVLEEARIKALGQPQDACLLPDDWNAWDVYVPNQVQPSPSVLPHIDWGNETEEPIFEPDKNYSKYTQEKTEEYYDKYILD